MLPLSPVSSDESDHGDALYAFPSLMIPSCDFKSYT